VTVGVAEVELDYSSTQAALDRAMRTVAGVVVLGLALTWLLLYRTVVNASRRLRAQASETARLALLDPLTGLPNRRLLNERLERAVLAAGRRRSQVGLILLDVDRFKEVNDSMGHPVGDELLVQVAHRLRGVVRDGDTVARLGGDEFAILLPRIAGITEAQDIAARIQECFDKPFDLSGLVLHVDTSVGLAVLPDHAEDVTALLQRADVAMYTAKAGNSRIATYSAVVDVNSPSRLVLLGDLRRALDVDDQLSMHYQPKIDLRRGNVMGLEALLRWRHPVRGPIGPTEFVLLAEQTGLMHALTARVLQLVCVQMAQWRAEGRELPVAVNLSARNLVDDDLPDMVEALLAQYDLPARLFEFEITESALVLDPEHAARTLRRIRALGIEVAVDDFGMGNTSMSQLRSMPLTTIKIDRSFVTNLASDPGDSVLVKAIVDLAHEFGLQAVAEGVEDDQVTQMLRDLDCDVAQGYLWSRPVPGDEVSELVVRLDRELRLDDEVRAAAAVEAAGRHRAMPAQLAVLQAPRPAAQQAQVPDPAPPVGSLS
jgi:diguanylate cyclase (GGDEF)-like protein